MKKGIYFILLFLFVTGCNNKKIETQTAINTFSLKQESIVELEYAKDVYLYDIIKEDDSINILTENRKLDTFTLGEHKVNIEYIKEKNRSEETITYFVTDKIKPLLLVSSSYTIEKGSNVNLINKAICADNYDKRPKCYIEGEYDIDKVGTYNLKYSAEDSSGNFSTKNFKLKVVQKIDNKTKNNKPKYKISDLIKKFKNDNTSIGIDVSSWQNDVDYNKVKNDGVEFVMIRLGYGHNRNGELILDNRFERNIKLAKDAGLKVGIYFYSYANTIEKVKEQVNYIIKKLNGQTLDLPIAFDWEDWKNFNTYNISLTDIRVIAQTFIDEVEKNGYKGALYSSKYYLEQIWGINSYNTWLAHYTNETSYSGKYFMWQLSNRGKVSGINGDVDFDILYK